MPIRRSFKGHVYSRHMPSAWLRLCAIAIAAAAAAAAGCTGEPHSYDCNKSCNYYKDCVDSTYDVASCERNCESMSGDSAAYGQTATNCQVCMTDSADACVVDAGDGAGAFTCGSACTGVVP
jgi:hypothetical protein